MNDFDWKKAESLNRPEILAFIKENKDHPLSMEKFVDGIRALGLPRCRPSKLKNQYKHLKGAFGFFA
jgi:hypothetical protein